MPIIELDGYVTTQCPLCTVPLYALPGENILEMHALTCDRWAEMGRTFSFVNYIDRSAPMVTLNTFTEIVQYMEDHA